jgi:5-methylcytosine-specific restriction endonuclease McrA
VLGGSAQSRPGRLGIAATREVFPSFHAPGKKLTSSVVGTVVARVVGEVDAMPMQRAIDGLLMACSGCHRMRPRGQFCKNGDGRRASRCKDCRAPTDRANAHKRRALERAAVGSFTAQDIENLKRLQNMVCACGCGRSLYAGFHVDHVMPLARGGTNWPSNLALLSPICNRTKGCRVPGAALSRAPGQLSDRRR